MKRYGMVVDLNRCMGCQTCTIACKQANDTPPGVQWRRVLDVEQGSFPNVQRLFLVTGCQHCAEPPCVPVCPTGATRQREDGLVTMNYDLCIGCGSCAVACPYQARTIVHDAAGYYGEPTQQERFTAHEDRIGVATKCTFCVDRIDAAAARGLVPGVDAEVTPACAASCIAQAIRFGDFADPASEVSRVARENANFQMHAGLGTDPRIRYLYEVPACTPGRDPEPADQDDEALSDPANPLAGERQSWWDYRAAMNFILGGMASGLLIVASLAALSGALKQAMLASATTAAGVIMALGLFFVFLKLGRKLHFPNVLLRPQTSWMTRETLCVAVFYPAAAANLLWPHPAAAAIAALAATGFLYCQAKMIHTSAGVPAWRAPLVPWLLVSTGLSEGLGLLVVLAAAFPAAGTDRASLATAGIVLAAIHLALWRNYVSGAKAAGIGLGSRRDLGRVSPLLHLLAHALPIACYGAGLATGSGAILLVGALGSVAGGALWKAVLLRRACHLQGFALPKLPQRGSGTRAAPPRLALSR